MCTYVIGLQVHPAAPLMVAGNRDEFYARASTAPRSWPGPQLVVAGRDEQEGGSWLGLTSWGVVGITNYPALPPVEPVRSRGLLVWEALQANGAEAALACCKPGVLYRPFHLFVADTSRVLMAYGRDGQVWYDEAGPGWHVLPNGVLDDDSNPKVCRGKELLTSLSPSLEGARLAEALRQRLADHQLAETVQSEPDWISEERRRALSSLCVHSPGYGTCSCSVVFSDGQGGGAYFYRPGHACEGGLEQIL